MISGRRLTDEMERHQVVLYLTAISVGVVVGLSIPQATVLAHGVTPLLAALLYATFLQVPARELLRSLRGGRFLVAVLVVNFVIVPLVVAAIFVALPADQALRIGVLLVLLCPCVDYVIVFSGIAGADNRRLLAATPVLLVLQMVALPVFLVAFMGTALADIVDPTPFVVSFLVLIVIPLVLAWLTQAWVAREQSVNTRARCARVGHTPVGHAIVAGASGLMVPLMVATLLCVVASEIPRIRTHLGEVALLIPYYVGFLVVMAIVGVVVSRMFGLNVTSRRAVVFSGATRNSLVVLPLALALPAGYELAAAAVVLQTFVEVIGMVIYIRVVPRLIPAEPVPDPH